MPVSMLTTKMERSNAWPTSAVRARATTMATSASMSGTRPATTAPKTTSRMTMAVGMPKKNSPTRRSCSDSAMKSRSAVHSPVISTSKVASSARSTTSMTRSMPSSGSGPMAMGRSTAWPSGETNGGCGRSPARDERAPRSPHGAGRRIPS